MLRRYHAEALRLHMGQILSTVQQDSSESEGDFEATMVRQRQWTGHRQSKFACSRCGRRHQPRKCLARGKACSKCRRGLNRFAAMCRAKKAFHSSLRPRVPSWYGFLPLSIVLGLTYHCQKDANFVTIVATNYSAAAVRLLEAADSKLKGLLAHESSINPSVAPVIQPCRSLPLALRHDVSKELHLMVSQGIIEDTDSSPWVSKLVVVRKKSGSLRQCADLRAVNKAVIPVRYPLPTVYRRVSSPVSWQ